MGVDLTLLPFEAEPHCEWAISHSVLFCERRRELNAAVAAIEQATGVPVPAHFATFRASGTDGNPCYGNTQETPFGGRLLHVAAGDLVVLATHDAVEDNAKNRAVWAYLAQMPPDTRIALFWH